MKKTIITIALVSICTLVLLFCFRYISGAQDVSLSEAEYMSEEVSGAVNGEAIDEFEEYIDGDLTSDKKTEERSQNNESEESLHAEEIKEYIKERIIPVVVGVLTSLSAVLASLGAIKKSLSRLAGARDDFKNEASERKSDFARQSALLEEKAKELSELARLIPQLEKELIELKAEQEKLNTEAYNIGKMVSLGFSGSQTVIRSGNGRKIAALLSECRTLSGKADEDDAFLLQGEGKSLTSEKTEDAISARATRVLGKRESEAVKNEEG